MIQTTRTLREATLQEPVEPVLAPGHADGCGGMSVLGQMVIAVGAPVLIASVALACVLFVPTPQELRGVVRAATAFVLLLVVIPCLWIVVVDPLVLAQRRLARAVIDELEQIEARTAPAEKAYAECLDAQRWADAKAVIEAIAPRKARRDALTTMRTLPISATLLAQVGVSQIASFVVVLVRILTTAT